MAFNKAPEYTHGSAVKTAVVLVNLGTPDEADAPSVRRYLKQFLSDPRVVEIPRAIWWLILNGIILPIRASKSAAKYALIWTKEGSPLKVHTEKQSTMLRGYLGEQGHAVEVRYAMSYGNPSLPDVLNALQVEGCDRILIVPAYPQYSATTTASIFDAVTSHYRTVRNIPELRFIKHYHDDPAYIAALKESVLTHWQSNGRGNKLVLSFHGVPKRTLLLGDPYHCECYKTARLLRTALGLTQDELLVTFQSRFGKAEWLQPYTAPTLVQLAKDGLERVDIMCPGFTSDCLETLEEISLEAKHDFLEAGGKEFHYIPCVNEAPSWVGALATITARHLQGWPTQQSDADKEADSAQNVIAANEARRLGAPK
ncbi:ferrochelatase [Actimicrobium sp. CCI2.3]|uniref:ferrochelatase n=1 Tax=Actimicrobium sp. CCI2.3 TaxID=3048616 RepID=UPI002AB5C42E|nr:ferrochelatase [Actimicrobium sp. CCI2.3]MDY7576057.1 ferrochelatase [Actimicrobium sp. CCI2.3]MEB0022987.1 ferrochelatase [Actimicrobium sp. CCI2.3]